MEIISTHTTSTSLVVPIRAYLNIKPPRYMNNLQRSTSSQTNTCTTLSLQETQHLCHPEHCLIFVGPEHQSSKIYHAFSNYIKTTFNNGLSLSEVDLSHLKRETTNHGPNLMEVDFGENMIPITHQQQASWKLTGEETLIPITHQVDACSCKLTGEKNSESTI